MELSASAVWNGDLKSGDGQLFTKSGLLDDTDYGLKPGRYPEELIGAAHAGCMAMVLAMILDKKGHTADRVEAKADVTVKGDSGGYEITKSHLTIRAKVPGARENDFKKAAEVAKNGCPVSKALKPEITMDATLED